MKSVVALVLLVAGVCVAATSGSLLGDEQASRAPIQAKEELAKRVVKGVADCDEAADKALKRPGSDAEAVATDQAACRVRRISPWVGQIEEPTQAQLEAAYQAALDAQTEATRTLAELPRLEPRTRLVQWFRSGGVGWLIGLVLIVVGAVLGRRAAHERATAPNTGHTDVPEFDVAVARLLAAVAQARALVAPLADGDDSPAARAIIEEMETDVLAVVVDDRGRYQLRDGFAVFAEYFGPFSAGERNLARAWSSLTDGYPHVALAALDAADRAFEQAATAYARRAA